MTTLKRLATHHPLVFSVLVTLSALVWYVVASLFATALVQDDVGWNVVEALGRLLGASFFVLLFRPLYSIGSTTFLVANHCC